MSDGKRMPSGTRVLCPYPHIPSLSSLTSLLLSCRDPRSGGPSGRLTTRGEGEGYEGPFLSHSPRPPSSFGAPFRRVDEWNG